MTELKNCMALLVLILIVAAFSSPFCTPALAVAPPEAVATNLHSSLKGEFPEGKFPLSSPMEKGSPKSVKVFRPTGLL